jgi:hypothetical protein
VPELVRTLSELPAAVPWWAYAIALAPWYTRAWIRTARELLELITDR